MTKREENMVDCIFQPQKECNCEKLAILETKRRSPGLAIVRKAIQQANAAKSTNPMICPIHQIPPQHFDTIYNLLKTAHGFNPWVANHENKTALTFAYESSQWSPKQLRMISALIIKGSEYEAEPDIYGFKPLHYACLLGLEDAVRHLMRKGVNLSERVAAGSNFTGDTPLRLAIKGAHQSLVRILCTEGGCNPALRDQLEKRL